MTDTVARLSFATFVFLLLAGLGLLYFTTRGAEGTEVQAEFSDAFGVLEGIDVRIEGAPAGTVDDVQLTDDGTSLVTMNLYEGIEPPRADASVSVRQQDLLGDTYVALDAGEDRRPLEGPIAPARSVSAPRFDDILTTFRAPVRDALGIIFTEAGIALDRRGAEVNEAMIHLRPALAALDELMLELDAQNASLRSLIADAERVTDQAARRSQDLGPAIDALASTLAVTAERTPQLDAGLATLPETLSRTRGTLDRLAVLTTEAQPFALALHDASPEIERTATLLGPFLDDARAAAADLGPTLELARAALDAGEPTLRELAVAVPELRATVPPLRRLVDALQPASDELGDAFFGADQFGAVEPFEDVGLGAIATEEPAAGDDPARKRARIAGVLTCESFGVEIRPGCLAQVIAGGGPGASMAGSPQAERSPSAPPDDAVPDGESATAGGHPSPPGSGPGGTQGRDPSPPGLLDRPRDPRGAPGGGDRGGGRRRLPDRVAERLRRLGLDRIGPSRRGRGSDALDFLLGP